MNEVGFLPDDSHIASHAFEFMETMMALHEMTKSEAIVIDEVRDSKWRLKQIMDSITTDDNKDRLKEWEEQYDGSMLAAREITDPAERKLAEEEARQKGHRALSVILQSEEDGFNGVAARMSVAMLQMKKRPRPRDLILRSVLIASVSAIESLMSELYRAQLLHQPPESLSADKEFSLQDLMRYGSIEEAVNSVVSRKVDAALRGGIEDWAALYEKSGINFRELCIAWDMAIEVFQRRNAFIHTRGMVNATYFRKAKNSPPIGTPLTLTEEYIHRSIASIITLGSLVAAKTWLVIDDKATMASTGHVYLYLDELMVNDYWSAVQKMADYIKNFDNPLDVKLTYRTVAWLAQKKIHGLATVKKTIEEWDTSALKPSFAFTRCILIEEWDEAISILNASRNRGESWVTSASSMPPVRFVDEAARRVTEALLE